MSIGNSALGEVFVVDDDPMVLNALTVFLSRDGYKVAGFSDGASFLEAAKSRIPICIILDVQMPSMTGIDLLKDLKAQDYPAPIFIVSGSGDIQPRSKRSKTAPSISLRSRSRPAPL